MSEKEKSLYKRLSLYFVVVSVLFVTALFVLGFITDEIVLENEDLFDSQVHQFLQSYTTDGLISLMKFFTFFGSTPFLLPAYVIIVFILYKKGRKADAIHIGLIAISSAILLFSLKAIFQRQRPEGAALKLLHTYSFPSGHALSSFIFCSIIIYLIWNENLSKIWKWLFSVLLILFSFMIGLSRLVLNLHYASDVLAGFCLGYTWVILSLWLMKRINKNKENVIA